AYCVDSGPLVELIVERGKSYSDVLLVLWSMAACLQQDRVPCTYPWSSQGWED
ncbi:hypothetical protein E2562_022910, partial [Oryza meyeriana var. granulata]